MHSIPYLLEQRRTGRQSVPCTRLLVSHLATLRGSEALGTCCTSLSFCPDDDGRAKLVVGNETSRLQIWCPDYAGGSLSNAFDTGHTGSILCTRFLLGSGGSKLVCCSTDRQVRLVDLQRQAARPFVCHRARVKALASVSPDVFLSASEDGTVRLYDIRLVGGGGRAGAGGIGPDPHRLLVEQRCERAGRSSLRIGINSLAVSPLAPHTFVTGGGDPFARLYDMRMLRGGGVGGSGGQGSAGGAAGAHGPRPAWVSAFAPHAVCTPSAAAGGATGFSSLGRVRHLTGVAFAAGGQHLLLSYSGDAIYAVDVKEHAMSAEQLEGRLRQHAGCGGVAAAPAMPPPRAAAAAWEFFTPPRRLVTLASVGTDDEPPPLLSNSDSEEAVGGGVAAARAARRRPPARAQLGDYSPRPLGSRSGSAMAATEAEATAEAVQPVPPLPPPGQGHPQGEQTLQHQTRALQQGLTPEQAPPVLPPQSLPPLLLQPPRLRQPPPPRQQPRQPAGGEGAAVREWTLLSLGLPAGTMTISAGSADAAASTASPPRQQQQQQQEVDDQQENEQGAANRQPRAATSFGLPAAAAAAAAGGVGQDDSGAEAGTAPAAGFGEGPQGPAEGTAAPLGVSPSQLRRQLAWYRYSLFPSGSGPRSAPADVAAATAAATTAATGTATAAAAVEVSAAAAAAADAAAAAAGGFGAAPMPRHRGPGEEQRGRARRRSAGSSTDAAEAWVNHVGAAPQAVREEGEEGGREEQEVGALTAGRRPIPTSQDSPTKDAPAAGERAAGRGGGGGRGHWGAEPSGGSAAASSTAQAFHDRDMRRRVTFRGISGGSSGDVPMADAMPEGAQATAARARAGPGAESTPPPLMLPSLSQPLLQSYGHQAELRRGLELVSQLTGRLAALTERRALRAAARQRLQLRQPQVLYPPPHQQPSAAEQDQAPVDAHGGGGPQVSAGNGGGRDAADSDSNARRYSTDRPARRRRRQESPPGDLAYAAPYEREPPDVPPYDRDAADTALHERDPVTQSHPWRNSSGESSPPVGGDDDNGSQAGGSGLGGDQRESAVEGHDEGEVGDEEGQRRGSEPTAAERRQGLKRRRVRMAGGDGGGGGGGSHQTLRDARGNSQASLPAVAVAAPAAGSHQDVDMEAADANGEVAAAGTAPATLSGGTGGAAAGSHSAEALRPRPPHSGPSPGSSDDDRLLPSPAPQGPRLLAPGAVRQATGEEALQAASAAPATAAASAAAALGAADPRVSPGRSLMPMEASPHHQSSPQPPPQQQRLFWARLVQEVREQPQPQRQQSNQPQQEPQQQPQLRLQGGRPLVWDSLLESVAQLEMAATAVSRAAAVAVALTDRASERLPPRAALPAPGGGVPLEAGGQVAAGASTSAAAASSPVPRAGVAGASAAVRPLGAALTPGRADGSDGADGGGAGEGGGGFLRFFDGHKNVMTIKEVAWLGGAGYGPSYVASGSDDGHVFMWDYDTADIVRMLPVQEHVIPTCLAVHASEPMLAACGNGSVVRVWGPGGSSGSCAAAAATTASARGAAAAAGAVDSGTEAGGREGRGELRNAQLRGVVAANRADLRRRQAEAVAEAATARRGRPVGAGWATFAAALRDRAADVTNAAGRLAPAAAIRTDLSARAAAAAAGVETPPPRPGGGNLAARARSPEAVAGQQDNPSRMLPPLRQAPAEPQTPPAGQILRLSTALERQRRRSGSPEETIPAFGLTPPAAPPAAGGGVDADGEGSPQTVGQVDEGGVGDGGGGGGVEGQEGGDMGLSSRACALM